VSWGWLRRLRREIGEQFDFLDELDADRRWREEHAGEVAEVHRVMDLLFDMTQAPLPEFRRGGYWVMPTATRAILLSLRCDRSGPLWRAYDGGEPDHLVGFPVRVEDDELAARQLAFVDNAGMVHVGTIGRRLRTDLDGVS